MGSNHDRDAASDKYGTYRATVIATCYDCMFIRDLKQSECFKYVNQSSPAASTKTTAGGETPAPHFAYNALSDQDTLHITH